MNSDISILTLNVNNKIFFIEKLKHELSLAFDTIPDNYGDKYPHSLLNLINNSQIDTYQLLYTNEYFWTASGGIVRTFDNRKVYQAGFRGFGNQKNNYNWKNLGLGSKSYSHEYLTKFQIERARQLNCEQVILSFNLHNKKLYEITKKYHLPKIFGKNVWKDSELPILFNGVQQWLLTMYL